MQKRGTRAFVILHSSFLIPHFRSFPMIRRYAPYAEALLRENITDADQRKLFNDSLREVGEA